MHRDHGDNSSSLSSGLIVPKSLLSTYTSTNHQPRREIISVDLLELNGKNEITRQYSRGMQEELKSGPFKWSYVLIEHSSIKSWLPETPLCSPAHVAALPHNDVCLLFTTLNKQIAYLQILQDQVRTPKRTICCEDPFTCGHPASINGITDERLLYRLLIMTPTSITPN